MKEKISWKMKNCWPWMEGWTSTEMNTPCNINQRRQTTKLDEIWQTSTDCSYNCFYILYNFPQLYQITVKTAEEKVFSTILNITQPLRFIVLCIPTSSQSFLNLDSPWPWKYRAELILECWKQFLIIWKWSVWKMERGLGNIIQKEHGEVV